MVAVTDGAEERHEGAAAVRAAWEGYLRAFASRGLLLRKALVAADRDAIVNTWAGAVGARTDARGIEIWRFDGDARVREHVLHTFLDVRPSTSTLARLRLGLGYPLTAAALLRETRRR